MNSDKTMSPTTFWPTDLTSPTMVFPDESARALAVWKKQRLASDRMVSIHHEPEAESPSGGLGVICWVFGSAVLMTVSLVWLIF
ncbi:hypothetical protein GGQ68_000847 [Sagittula marina]|uniref:Uncharacterized protein n=1 Tax=Sagittula marina TaxID=943940 RepID=A0A7W6DJR9_9RHOB|nr:hypothetical protein [Sagittula marina]MBB3984531.1 hypothetical protein [Sagittula marina]